MLKTLELNHMQRDSKLFLDFDSSKETQPIFFFYTWDKPAITIGKIQRNREALIKEAETLGIPCYLRPTGGRAVLHGGLKSKDKFN
jgi:lipoate-protein ligase A